MRFMIVMVQGATADAGRLPSRDELDRVGEYATAGVVATEMRA